MKKTCSKCKKEKPKDQFSKHPNQSDGRLGTCKECVSKVQRKKHLEKTAMKNLFI